MSSIGLQLAKQIARLSGVAAVAVALVGCQSIAGTQQYSQVRVIDASVDAGGLDIYENKAAFAYNIGFGTISSYVPFPPAVYSFAVDAAGTKQQLAAVSGTAALGGQYTVLIGNVAASLQMTYLQDKTTPAPTGQFALRIIDQSTRSTPVDIYLLPSGGSLNGVSPIATNLSFGSILNYTLTPAGTFAVIAVPTGTVPTATTTSALYTGSQVTYPGGSARTILLLDQQYITMPGLQVITADDYDSPSATS